LGALIQRLPWITIARLPLSRVGGGCGVGLGLGWGFGAAWGSSYRIGDPEFGDPGSAPTKPRWFSQLQQQLRIAKFEASHHEPR
jgi:hypothetical protein